VLAPNYRGSAGYGKAWHLANRFEMGRGDTMDVAAGVDYLVSQGLADSRRIAVTGRSHGGYLTMSCLTSYPERWAAGSAVVPFLNWFTTPARASISSIGIARTWAIRSKMRLYGSNARLSFSWSGCRRRCS
jgi:dipeptidyl aminopeptidase/acylaminoacyl peptidase